MTAPNTDTPAVAWRWRYDDDGQTNWYYGATPPITVRGRALSQPIDVEPLYAAAPAPDLAMREAVAREIDPEAFITLRQVCARAGKDWDSRPSVVYAAYDPDGPIPNRDGKRQAAFAKADAILSLLRSTVGRGE